MNYKEELPIKIEKIESIIQGYLPQEEGVIQEIVEAMNYNMLAGGKRIRPMLMQETYCLFGGKDKVIEPFMVAIEMVHTHSLIHDDLPAIDNDEYRRGKKTTHVVYGEDMAILCGDALLNYAYETAFRAFEREECMGQNIAKALKVLGDKVGVYGMLGGQSVDVKNDGQPLTPQLLEYIYVNKTSALIEASMMVGAILAGASSDEVSLIESVGYKIGLAFQIQDDILDVTSTKEELGKPIHSDQKNLKTTYVTLYGIEKAKERVRTLSREAIESLEELEGRNEFLFELIQALITRRK